MVWLTDYRQESCCLSDLYHRARSQINVEEMAEEEVMEAVAEEEVMEAVPEGG